MRRRGGFTLIELVVVLGIAAVLTALLAPGLARARTESNRIKCESNLHQILAACVSYEYDNEGACPWSNWLGPEVAGYRPQGWLYKYPQGIGPQAAGSDATSGSLYSRLGTLAVYHCPEDAGPYNSGPTQTLTSYLINGATCGYGRHLPSYRVTAFSPNAIMFWEADPLGHAWTDGAIYPSHEITGRHNNGGTVGCYDSHVEWFSVGDFAAEEQNLPGRLWCNPGTRTGT